MERIAALREAIRTHMFDRIAVSRGVTCLHDPETLDCLDAIGDVRIIANLDTDGGDPDGPKAIRKLDDDLASVPQGMRSAAPRRQVRRLQVEQGVFSENLTRETDGLRTPCRSPEYSQQASREAPGCGRIPLVVKEASASANRARVATVVPRQAGHRAEKQSSRPTG